MVKPDPNVEQAIREAAQRLLSGKPRTVTSDRLSVVELAEEAGVPRARLYREYAVLKDDFILRAEQVTADPPPATPRERQLTEQVDALTIEVETLRERVAGISGNKTQWKEAAEAAFRIVNLLEREMQKMEVKSRSDEKGLARLQRQLDDLRAERQGEQSVSRRRASFAVLPGTPEDRVEGAGETSTSGDY